MAKNRELTYSQALDELEKIVGEIESEEVDVDQLADKIKRASTLVTFCRTKLRTAEDEVKKVLSDMADRPDASESGEEGNGF